MSDDNLNERVRQVIAHALANLSEEERQRRIAYCQRHNEHGTRVFTNEQDDLLEFRWGGEVLALVGRADLLSDGVLWPQYVADVPDTVPDGWEL